jgi:hypothetical protein
MSNEFEIILPKEINVSVLGPNLIVSPLTVPMKKSEIKLLDDDIINPNTGARFDLNKSKKFAEQANDFYLLSPEHPFQGIIVAMGHYGEERGFHIGDLIYTDTEIYRSRRVIKVNGFLYTILGVDSVHAVVHNYKLEKEEHINSIYIK